MQSQKHVSPIVANEANESARKKAYLARVTLFLLLWIVVAAAAFAASHFMPGRVLFGADTDLLQFLGTIACILAGVEMLKLVGYRVFTARGRPAVESIMIGRLYNVVAALAIIVVLGSSLGKLGALGAVFAAFGGMFLGWSLQAPVSGLAAWVLVSLKRPFRPGDRIQFPNLGLTGDVMSIGVMYTVLNQVGGTIGSEEAVGRYILVPNAMLFSQVVINYTVLQESPYMLDEVVVRITYDSDWQMAEKILVDAATEATREIIQATGQKPYIRSDMYDYGVYMRLRYMTRVQDRPEISSDITKKVYTGIQGTDSVDIAIPFIYSYRAGLERKEDEASRGEIRESAKRKPRPNESAAVLEPPGR